VPWLRCSKAEADLSQAGIFIDFAWQEQIECSSDTRARKEVQGLNSGVCVILGLSH